MRVVQVGLPVKYSNEDIGIIGKDYPLNLYVSYGIHNGFGLDFERDTGNLWDTEIGHFTFNNEVI